MISADGERSRKRLHVAKKALAVISDLDLPVKASMFEGFTYKVWRDAKGDLSGGRITAPAGIFVLLSDEVGLKQFVCDSFECAAAPLEPVDRYLPAPDPLSAGAYTFTGGAGQMMQTQPDVPAGYAMHVPTCLPVGGEFVAVHASWGQTIGGLPYWRDSSGTTHCYSNGLNDTAAPHICGAGPYGPTGSAPHKLVPLLAAPGYYERIVWKQGNLYVTAKDKTQALFDYQANYIPGDYYYGLQVTTGEIFAGLMSAQATAKITDGDSDASLGAAVFQTCAHFSRVGSNVRGVMLLQPGFTRCALGDCSAEYADPESSVTPDADMKWKPSLAVYDMAGGANVVNQDVLRPLAVALLNGELGYYRPEGFGADLADDPHNLVAGLALRVLFGWPDASFITAGARDTVTFADAAGDVYSWLRCCDPSAVQNVEGAAYAGARLGGFKFVSPAGLERVAMAMPPEVLADATLRPKIMLMTDFTYHCVADRADGTVGGLYVGSPFAAWEAVAFGDGVTMLAVRVTLPADTALGTGFIGIGRETVSGADRFGIYLKSPGATAWARLSPLPVAGVSQDARFDVCVFGDDPLASGMMSARQHPVAQEQMQADKR